MRIYIFLFFFLFCTSTFAQKEYNIWYFGEHVGIDFNTMVAGKPAILTNSGMFTPEGCATICDAQGQLLFYTNGEKVWNRAHEVMPHGDSLYGHESSSQSAVIIPWPTKKNLYYVFTTDAVERQGTYGLRYSIVDMTIHGGMGDVTTVHIPLLSPVMEKLTAVRHSNKRDIWIIVQTIREDSLYAYLVTPTGVRPPVISASGLPPHPSLIPNAAGYMQASPDGKRLALATYETGIGSERNLRIFDFNPSTGIVSRPMIFSGIKFVVNAYGIEFSPNSQLVYASVVTASGDARVYQFRLDGRTPEDIVASGKPVCMGVGALQMGPDNKIYISSANKSLHVIHQPNNLGEACGCENNSLIFVNRTGAGLPNSLVLEQAALFTLDIYSQRFCFGDSTAFSLSDSTGIDSVRWNFGDLASGTTNTASVLNPFHQFSAPGTYTISAEFFSGTMQGKGSTTITIHALPQVKISTICHGNFYTLSAEVSENVSYYWSTGETTSSIKVIPGTYWVRVFNGFCFATDSIEIGPSGLVLKISKNQTICPNGSVQLSVSGAESYRWTPTEGLDDPTSPTPTVSPKANTTYTVTGTTASGCSTTAQVTVTIRTLTPLQISAKAQTLCAGGRTQLFASGAESYEWTPAEGLDNPTSPAPFASPATTTTYTVVGTDAFGCTTSAQVTITVLPSPSLSVSQNQDICIGKNTLLSASGAKNYLWTPTESLDNPTSPTPAAAPKVTTIYTVTGTDEFGCTTSAQVTLTVHPLPALTIIGEQTICAGTSVPLSVSGAATYLWTPAESLDNPTSPTPLATPKITTVYTVTGTNEFGCSTSAQVTLTVSSQPAFTVSLGRDTVLCNQPQFLLKTGLTGAPHLWSTGETSEQITVTQSGNYWVAVGSDACAGRDSITVLFENLQLQAKAQKDIICQGESLRLEVSGAAIYLWAPAESLDDPTSATPLASPKKTTTYTVTGTGQHGCIVQQQLTIKVIESDHAQFSIDNASGNPGDIVTLPVYAQTDHALPDTLGTVHLELQTDAFAFEATGCSPGVLSQKIAADELTISIDLSGVILTRQRQVLTQIRGRVMSSYSSEVPIHVRQAHIQECEQKDRQDGTLYLTGCALRNRVVLRPISISITPNPVSEQAEIRVLSEEVGEHTITLYNVQGQKVWSQTFAKESGEQIYTVPVDHFPAGVYEAILYCPSGTITATMYVAH